MPEKLKKVELLAPAGDVTCAVGAINAGADAIYLGTEEYSARAYARNLTTDEAVEMIRYAHLHHKKVYLTMNTLIKTMEWKKAVSILDRLDQNGLDAVIVQDIGLLGFLSGAFPELEIHASTQMSILSSAGMEWLKQYHVTRVVPGRELSLAELKVMKNTGMELECFIHGAMCYSYSGKCLMSSLAGGRSGNRGRCAGPCRKAYVQGHCSPSYLLSMKDMCSVEWLPKLLRTGIDSLKIEGRMKAPEYAAGVTSVYRKVIDRLENDGVYKITNEEMSLLQELYIRSELQDGYFGRHNGREMISLSSPSYAASSDACRENIRKLYLSQRKRCPIYGKLKVEKDKPVTLILRLDEDEIKVEGAVAAEAVKRAVSDEELKKHILKTGNTFYEFRELIIENDGQAFVPVSRLNEIRREAFEKLDQKIFDCGRTKKSVSEEVDLPERTECRKKAYPASWSQTPRILAGVKTMGQLKTVLSFSYVDGVILDFFLAGAEAAHMISGASKKWYLRLPEIIREKDLERIKNKLADIIADTEHDPPEGIYCPSMDALYIAEEIAKGYLVIADQGIYIMNVYAETAILEKASSYTAAFELNKKELNHAIRKDARELIIYGYLPMMYSANCVMNTVTGCNKKERLTSITDEEGRIFPIIMEHEYCYNIIYNCVPLSLHRECFQIFKEREACALRLEFTIETKEDTATVLRVYKKAFENADLLPDEKGIKEYTKGHFNRGVL